VTFRLTAKAAEPVLAHRNFAGRPATAGFTASEHVDARATLAEILVAPPADGRPSGLTENFIIFGFGLLARLAALAAIPAAPNTPTASAIAPAVAAHRCPKMDMVVIPFKRQITDQPRIPSLGPSAAPEYNKPAGGYDIVTPGRGWCVHRLLLGVRRSRDLHSL